MMRTVIQLKGTGNSRENHSRHQAWRVSAAAFRASKLVKGSQVLALKTDSFH